MHHEQEQLPLVEAVRLTGDVYSLKHKPGWTPGDALKHFEAAVEVCEAAGGHPGWHDATAKAAMKSLFYEITRTRDRAPDADRPARQTAPRRQHSASPV